MTTRHYDDADLLQVLADALAVVEPVPDDALAAAYAAAELRTIDEELAVLVFDSGGTRELVGMRGPDVDVRLLSFAHGDTTIDLQLPGEGDTLVGQVTPVVAAAVLVETEAGEVVEAAVDSAGRFRVAVPDGVLRVRVVGVFVTPWVN
jgi:hypothetical protein